MLQRLTTKVELKLPPSWSVLLVEEMSCIIEQKRPNLFPGEVEASQP